VATSGTVASGSYKIETEKFFSESKIFQQACPMWVPLVERMMNTIMMRRLFYKKNVGSVARSISFN
jgi:glutamate racemase